MADVKIPEGFSFFEEFDALDMGEIEDVEELTGITFVRMAKPGFEPPMKLIRATLYVVMRREDPSVVFEDLRGIKFSDLNAAADADEETELDPTS